VKPVGNDDKIGWFKIFDVLNHGYMNIPAQMFFLPYLQDDTVEELNFPSVSTGTASHTSHENAFKNALIEYLQTDSLMLFWYGNNVQVPKVILDDKMKIFLKKNNLYPEDEDILILDLTMDKPFPILGIFIISDEYPTFSFGIQGSQTPYEALYRGFLEATAVLEHSQGSFFYNNEKFISFYKGEDKFDNLDSNAYFWASKKKTNIKKKFLEKRISGEKSIKDMKSLKELELVKMTLKYIKDNNFNLGCYDITCTELGLRDWFVIRTIIPELLPICIPNKCFSNHPRFLKTDGCKYVLPHPLP
jgi:thiazole/oxazole-forming peptide maturase SagD family component